MTRTQTQVIEITADGLPVDRSAWYVVRVRANAERRVAQSLANREIDVFLPMQSKVASHTRKRRRPNASPLFAGYVFACFGYLLTSRVLTCPGVVHIVSRGGIPEAVDPDEMFALRTLARAARSVEALPAFTPGQKVKIREGPLADVEAVIVRDNGRDRLIVSISLLARSVIAEVEREWIDCAVPGRDATLGIIPWQSAREEKGTRNFQ